MKLFDTHAHYTDSRFAEEYEGGTEKLLSELFASDVEGIVNASVNADNAAEVIALAARYEKMYAAVGVHPTDSRDCDNIDSELSRIEEFLKNKEANKIVAVGEIGFDYYWEPYSKEEQSEYFSRQLALAEKYGLPAVIHNREASGDTVAMLSRFPNVTAVIHSCSLSAESVKEVTRGGGTYVSFSGTVTFKNANKVREAAAAVPIDRILSETDCPYLAPHPHRGKLNHSGLMRHTVTALSEVYGVSEDKMAEILLQNARRVFKIG